MNYILILFVTIGPMSDKDSVALTNVPGFITVEQCKTAGDLAVSKFGTGTKRAEYVCVEQSKL